MEILRYQVVGEWYCVNFFITQWISSNDNKRNTFVCVHIPLVYTRYIAVPGTMHRYIAVPGTMHRYIAVPGTMHRYITVPGTHRYTCISVYQECLCM